MNKSFSPGRIYKINGIVVRAKRQSTCKGCIFDNLFSCPRVADAKREITCTCHEDNVIFINP
jgi:hypothetical protein